MTETSQNVPPAIKPLGLKGDILVANPKRLTERKSTDADPVLPEGTKGYLAANPDFGKSDGYYHPPFHFSTNPEDALPPLPDELQQQLTAE